MKEMGAEPAGLAQAEAAFGFLPSRGFRLVERHVTGGVSFRDGWRLSFEGPSVRVIVQYLDVQFEVHFERAGVRTDYLFIDRERFQRRSGYHGNMFSGAQLVPAIEQIAADIRDNYAAVLTGDDKEWATLASLAAEPAAKRRLP
jgi:hypothetical protein